MAETKALMVALDKDGDGKIGMGGECVRAWRKRAATDESQWCAAGSCPLFSAEMPGRCSHETVSQAQNK